MDRHRRKELADKVRYGNLRFENGGAVTIASLLDRENQILYYGCAYCNPNDQFVKKIGAWIAKDNMFKYLRHEDDYEKEPDLDLYQDKYGRITFEELENNFRTWSIFDIVIERAGDFLPKWLQETLVDERYINE